MDQTLEPEKQDLRSHDLAEDERRELLRRFPEIRTDGKIDFDRLKLILGEMVEVGRERFGLTWPGKADLFKTIQAPSLGTLLPRLEESFNFDTTENLIIEGDNLEVLKLLQKSYLGRIKMIYIDPPYNTGNDFIYPDDYSESLRTYLQYTGQLDGNGKKFSTNTDTDGRFHSKWLNMMYPRLYLARNLLAEDGVIFISIDENEDGNLRIICNEIFGEENFVACVVWKHTAQSKNDERYFARHYNNLIVYRKTEVAGPFRLERTEAHNLNYANPDNDPRGPWRSGDVRSPNPRPTMRFPIPTPSGKSIPPPPKGWRWKWETIQEKIELGEIIFSDDETKIIRKIYLSEQEGRIPENVWSHEEVGATRDANREIKELFGDAIFDTPKPTALVRRMLQLATSSETGGIVLDFFAGSGTTAQAILELNKEDRGNRKFILVQLPEPTVRQDYPTIADICKERVRRVIQKLNEEDQGKPSLDGQQPQDRGFGVFKLAESNFNVWNARVESGNAEALQQQLEMHVEHIREGRSSEDILYELLLKSGFPLTTPVETITLAGKRVYKVAEGMMLICLERELSLDLIRAMADQQPQRVVCLDEGFDGDDQLKANAVQTFRTRGVESFRTV